MSSEMRELLKKYETRLANFERLYGYNEQAGADARWNRAHMLQCRDIVDDLRALLARTEAGADGLCEKHGAMWAKGCAACDRDLDQMPGPPDASPGADGAAMLVRDVCEMPQADPDAPDTVCIRVSDLTRIAELYTSTGQTSDARDGE